MRTRHAVERYVDAFSLVVKAPRTTKELSQLVGLNVYSMRRLMNAMCSEGLLLKKRAPNAQAPAILWRWNR